MITVKYQDLNGQIQEIVLENQSQLSDFKSEPNRIILQVTYESVAALNRLFK